MLKVPPHSIEAEQSVLWSILIDKDWLIVIWDMLKETDFYSEANSKIYEVIMELYKANKAIDLITVKEKLDDKNLLDKIWWISYLTDLTEIVPTTANIFEYASIVKNKSVLRNLLKAWNEIIWYGYFSCETIYVKNSICPKYSSKCLICLKKCCYIFSGNE